ncbi:MAG TPA: PA2169 family four-helix-bundle protein [Bryobacteraceae bacterium]|nr:PA2169 family four-helix-bundle protein [Bryobacteraceae bacterium]
MALEMDEIYGTLNGLIETCQDGEQGFREAAEGTHNSQTRQIFLEYAQQRSRFASELQILSTEIGGRPKKSGSVSGALHRGWMNLRKAIAGNDEGAIIAEAERGEDAAVEAYSKALAQDLPADIREVVDRQYRQVLEAHERIRAMELRAHGGRTSDLDRDSY